MLRNKEIILTTEEKIPAVYIVNVTEWATWLDDPVFESSYSSDMPSWQIMS